MYLVGKKKRVGENSGPEQMRKELEIILPEIRFPIMDSAQLSRTVYPSKILPDDVMLELLLYMGSGGTQGKVSFRKEKRQPVNTENAPENMALSQNQ